MEVEDTWLDSVMVNEELESGPAHPSINYQREYQEQRQDKQNKIWRQQPLESFDVRPALINPKTLRAETLVSAQATIQFGPIHSGIYPDDHPHMQKAEWNYWASLAEQINGKRMAYKEKHPNVPHTYLIIWDARFKEAKRTFARRWMQALISAEAKCSTLGIRA